MNESTFAELAAGHALGALSATDQMAFDAALVEHPEWEAHVRTEVDTVALLSDSIEPVTAPPALREALLARIAVTPQTRTAAGDPDVAPETDAAGEPAVPPSRVVEDFAAAGPAPVVETAPVAPSKAGSERGMRRWFTLAASFVALLALGFGAVVIGQQLTRPAAVVALDQIESASDAQSATVAFADGGEATAHWSPSLGEVVFVSEGLPALPEDRTYELWFVRAEEGPIPAGIFAAEGGTATALLTGDYQPGDVIAVTVEPSGGSPTGQPSTDPIVAIETA